MLKCDPVLFLYVQFSFVRYSEYIIFRVLIHVSPRKKAAVVRATRVVYTIVYIVYNLLSAACIVIPIQSVFDSANIPRILPKIHRHGLIRSVNSIN